MFNYSINAYRLKELKTNMKCKYLDSSQGKHATLKLKGEGGGGGSKLCGHSKKQSQKKIQNYKVS